MSHHHSVDLVVSHDTRGDAHVLVLRNGVDLFGHDRADGRTAIRLRDQVRGRNDTLQVAIVADDGQRVKTANGKDSRRLAHRVFHADRDRMLLHDVFDRVLTVEKIIEGLVIPIVHEAQPDQVARADDAATLWPLEF